MVEETVMLAASTLSDEPRYEAYRLTIGDTSPNITYSHPRNKKTIYPAPWVEHLLRILASQLLNLGCPLCHIDYTNQKVHRIAIHLPSIATDCSTPLQNAPSIATLSSLAPSTVTSAIFDAMPPCSASPAAHPIF
ncbi:unnamed protein product [Linum trigynum]|uniref:Uncharacterized protein n=1 Tax=Linum trigynum TaxID=586398 RepID=A0AAV2FAH8_9ROSI